MLLISPFPQDQLRNAPTDQRNHEFIHPLRFTTIQCLKLCAIFDDLFGLIFFFSMNSHRVVREHWSDSNS